MPEIRTHTFTVEVLGSGTSMGVPVVGCDCPVCRSDDPRDKRLRASVMIRIRGMHLLIDTSIDFRQQALRSGIHQLDAVLYTHHHVDHILGMDDLRSLNFFTRRDIPIYATRETLAHIRRVFAYVFEPEKSPSDIPRVIPREITTAPFTIGDVRVQPIPLWHGPLPILGFRIGRFAYCTDVSRIPEESFSLLEGLEVFVLGALRRRSHPTHFSLEEAIQMAQKINAQQTYFIHMSHDLGHAQTEAELPDTIHLTYDGLTLTVSE